MTEIDLTLTRNLPAPPKRVFELWSDARHRVNWWCPRGLRCAEFTHDFKAGGTWQARLEGPETGNSYWMGGRYLEIEAPSRLRFSFAWLEDGTQPGPESVITVTLETAEKGTRQVFHQSAFETAETRDAHATGWSECLDRLELALA